jgi:ring-1,2-phenylacetyl-CoA epoxidase subunit PaaE
MNSVMFNEALQDLKDRYPDRLTLIHVLSRQAQEAPLFEGRIDESKVRQLVQALLPATSMDEVFICGPEAMIEATETALLAEGVPANRIHSERFTSNTPGGLTPVQIQKAVSETPGQTQGAIALTVVLDGKSHSLRMSAHEHVLDVALASGLDLPYSCKGGVCCTCRAKIMQGSVVMDKNFTLEPWESAQGFVLSCQARPTSDKVVISYDER